MRSRDDYHGDVIYDVWHAGGNPDLVDDDRVDEHYDYDDEVDAAVRDELRSQR